MRNHVGFLLLSALCAAPMLLAQGDRGLITGTIKDPAGAVVPGVQVTVTEPTTNATFKTVSNQAGDYSILSLPVGIYQIRAESAGFKTYVRENVEVGAGATALVDIALEIGAAQQTVEVSGDAQLLEAETARVATQVSNQLVNDLPVVVNGAVRSPFDLAGITPDVAGSSSSDFRVGGGRAGSFGITLDGNSIGVAATSAQVNFTVINTPSVEALTEFNVESGGFKAESGHASGGTVSFVSKSGTNQFHGDLYEFLRNQDLDAKGFFGAVKPVYKQNDFGATAGGPVWLPKLYNGRNKTFFFFSYEGFRNRVGATPTPLSVPPPEFFSGNLGNWVNASGQRYQIYDPSTTTLQNGSYVRTPFPNNQVPQSRIDPVAQAILSFVQPLVVPNVPNLQPGASAYVRNNYVSTGTTLAPNNKYSIKADQLLTSKQRVSFFFERTREYDQLGANGPTGLPVPLSGNPGFNRSDVYRISYDYTLTPTLLNRFYAGGNNWEQNHASAGTTNSATQAWGLQTSSINWKQKGICIPGYPNCNADFPVISFGSDFTSWGVAAPNGSDNIVVEFHDDMTKTRGSHTLKWGYFYNNTHYNGFGEQNIAGNATFSDLGTSIPLNTNLATGGGSAFASFLLGYASGYSLDTPRYIAAMYRTHQMYVQDDWRVSSRFTLNLGLRYEINLAPIVGQNELSDLDPTLPNPAAGGLPGALIFAGNGPGTQNRRSLIANWYGGVGPRIGFSYAASNKTTIRVAATRSYGPVEAEATSGSHYLGFIVRTTATDASQGLSPLFVLSQGPPAYPKLPSYDPSIGNGVNVPYYNGNGADRASGELTYAFNIQRQVGSNVLAEVGYLGVLASDIQSSLLALNQINYTALPPSLNPFTASGRTLLNSLIGSAAANAAGIASPFPGFNALWGGSATVAQAFRPFPMYSSVDTTNGGGDRLGHSTYHSMQVRFQKRYSSGVTIQGSYVLSKLLTDSDSGGGEPEDNYYRRLEKSIGAYDQTHNVKFNYVYDLPFGAGKRFLGGQRVAAAIFGGWRLSGIQQYVSGTPMSLGTTVSFPIFDGGNRPTVPTYDGWRGTYTGKFDPFRDNFFQPVSFFGPQPTIQLGNMTRFNPKLRAWPNFNESASLARSIRLHKEQQRLEFRWEAFNYLNRTAFGPLSGGTTLQNANFGVFQSQTNSARRMQASLKLYW